MADKSSFEVRADEMLREGAKRVGPGEVVKLRPGYTVTILTGYGAWDEAKGRLVCTGQVDTDNKIQAKDARKNCEGRV